MTVFSKKMFDALRSRIARAETRLTTNEADIDVLEAISETTYGTTISEIRTAEVTLTATEIVGTTAGDLGHTNGAILVAAPAAGIALDFISAVVVYDYDTAAYTGGAGDDLVINVGAVAVSPAIATADLITKASDALIKLNALAAADYALTTAATINMTATEVTQPGTAAGVIRVKVSYRVITTGL